MNKFMHGNDYLKAASVHLAMYSYASPERSDLFKDEYDNKNRSSVTVTVTLKAVHGVMTITRVPGMFNLPSPSSPFADTLFSSS